MWLLPVDSGLSEEFESFARCLMIAELVGLDCVEKYLPHRVAMQFEIDQDLPVCAARANKTASIAWSNYIKSIGCANLYVPSRLFEANATTPYSQWWRQSVSRLQSARKGAKKSVEISKEKEKVCDVSASAGLPLEKLRLSQIVQKNLKLAEAEETSEEDGMTIAKLLRSRKRRNAVGSGQLGDGESLGNLQFFSSLMEDKEITKFVDPLTASIENVTLNATVETGLETAKKDADETETGSRSHDMERFQGCESDGDQYAAEMQELQHEDQVSELERIFVELKAKRRGRKQPVSPSATK
ncbi:hypothetical protein LWI28_009977 [Acer negundo]|uniref:Aminotransferase-like plant mobile domain-containing protein n=1 Tax=Acer negundo TaxID=4023 RepID=A0AAD5J4Q6_ACENE|nr:hypothetical protein LWI28_009977 [Acer negundo]